MQSIVLSEHSLGTCARLVRSLASAPPSSPDIQGRTQQHHLLVVAHYNEELSSPMLSLADLTVETSQTRSTMTTQLDFIATYTTRGAATDIHVTKIGSDQALVSVATNQGSAMIMRMTVPCTPGAGPEAIQLIESPVNPQDKQQLAPQFTGLHASTTSSVDVHPGSHSMLTVGEDGVISLLDLKAVSGGALGRATHTYKNAWNGTAAYTKARWADTSVFYTADVFGGLATWDVRVGTRPVGTTPRIRSGDGLTNGALDTFLNGGGVRCCWWVEPHPSRAHLAGTGEAGGRMAVWDMRFNGQPLVGYVADDPGDVWQVQFDPSQSGAEQAVPGLLFCTEGGTFGLARQGAMPFLRNGGTYVSNHALETCPLYTSEFAINSFDMLGSSLGMQEMVAVADNNRLVYMQRAT